MSDNEIGPVGNRTESLGVAVGFGGSVSARPGWQVKAACRGVDLDVFYPIMGKSATTLGDAIAMCAGCPVRNECADAGAEEDYGVWGGKGPAERRATVQAD